MNITRALMSALVVPWNAFVGVFLYYTALTLVMIGGGEISEGFVAAAFLIPVALYAALLMSRAVRGLAGLRVDIGPTPQALLR